MDLGVIRGPDRFEGGRAPIADFAQRRAAADGGGDVGFREHVIQIKGAREAEREAEGFGALEAEGGVERGEDVGVEVKSFAGGRGEALVKGGEPGLEEGGAADGEIVDEEFAAGSEHAGGFGEEGWKMVDVVERAGGGEEGKGGGGERKRFGAGGEEVRLGSN